MLTHLSITVVGVFGGIVTTTLEWTVLGSLVIGITTIELCEGTLTTGTVDGTKTFGTITAVDDGNLEVFGNGTEVGIDGKTGTTMLEWTVLGTEVYGIITTDECSGIVTYGTVDGTKIVGIITGFVGKWVELGIGRVDGILGIVGTVTIFVDGTEVTSVLGTTIAGDFVDVVPTI